MRSKRVSFQNRKRQCPSCPIQVFHYPWLTNYEYLYQRFLSILNSHTCPIQSLPMLRRTRGGVSPLYINVSTNRLGQLYQLLRSSYYSPLMYRWLQFQASARRSKRHDQSKAFQHFLQYSSFQLCLQTRYRYFYHDTFTSYHLCNNNSNVYCR